MQPLHPLLRGHTDRSFAALIADRPLDVQEVARHRRQCLIYARQRASAVTAECVAAAFASSANAFQDELVTLLHNTRPSDPVHFPTPPSGAFPVTDQMMGSPTERDALTHLLRQCAARLPGGRHV